MVKRTDKEKQEMMDWLMRRLKNDLESWFLGLVVGFGLFVVLVFYYPDDPSLPKWIVNTVYWIKGLFA